MAGCWFARLCYASKAVRSTLFYAIHVEDPQKIVLVQWCDMN